MKRQIESKSQYLSVGGGTSYNLEEMPTIIGSINDDHKKSVSSNLELPTEGLIGTDDYEDLSRARSLHREEDRSALIKNNMTYMTQNTS